MMAQASARRHDAPTAAATGVEVVTLVTSAGGLEALSAVLRSLPEELPAAVVVAQHLSGQGSVLVEILGRRTPLPVVWARDGEPIEARRTTICPPRSALEVLPDRTCLVRPIEPRFSERPLDALLASIGDSFGAAALGVVMTGMGNDGAAGAVALRAAGGIVIAQSEDSAEQPAMPRAAIAAGAVDLVLPLHEIGPVIVDVVSGKPLPRADDEEEAIRLTFGESDEIARRAREIDWTRHPLGPVHTWPSALRQAIQFATDSSAPVSV